MPNNVLNSLLEELGGTNLVQDEQFLSGMILPRLGKKRLLLLIFFLPNSQHVMGFSLWFMKFWLFGVNYLCCFTFACVVVFVAFW